MNLLGIRWRLLGIPSLGLLGLLLSGCVVTTELFVPSAEGGRVTKALCPPVSSFVLFDRMSAVIGVMSSRPASGELAVVVTLEIPQGVTFRLAAPEVLARISTGEESTGLLAYAATDDGLSWSSELTGITERRFWERVTYYGTTEHAYHVLGAALELADAPSHQIVLPPMLINGERISLPAMTFRQASESWLFSGNC